MNKQIYFGIGLLIILVLSVLLYLVDNVNNLFLLGFPSWVWYFIILHLALVGLLYWYSKSGEEQ